MKTFTSTLLACLSIIFSTQIGNSQFSLAFDCGDNVSVEACGSGAIDSTSVTLCISDTASLDSILVELAVKGDSSDFGATTITTSTGEVVVVEFDDIVENIGSNEEAAIYRAWVQPASKITATNPSSDPFLEDWQSMTAFKIRRNLACMGGSASLEGILLYHACDTLTFAIPQTMDPRNVTIVAPISEYGDGAPRTAFVTVDAIHNDTVWQQYSYIDTLDADSNITDFLLLYESMIIGLPGDVDTIKVGFLSPGPPNGCLPGDGDSFVVGTVAVSAECDPGDCCTLEPTCPPAENGDCIADITPIPASLLDTIMGSDSIDFVNLGGELNVILCDSFHIIAMDDTVGMGCPGDPYIVTRTFDFYTQLNELDATCTQTFTFIDSIRPTIECPADVTAECLEVILPFADFYEFLAAGGTADDNCALDTSSFVMISELSDGMTCPETITRMYEIADSCGLLDTCTHIIMVDDDLAPTITCPVDVTLECTDDTSPTANGAGIATATDLCDVTISVSGVLTPGDCPQEYTMVRTWTAVDGCGNSVSCDQNITVVDTTPPDITCPDDATVECTADPNPDFTGVATATDNCGDVTVSYSDVTASGNCPAEYTITRTWTAVDACGNEASCPQTIDVLDTQKPDLTCAADITIECDESADPANTGTSVATDECSDVTVTYQDATISDELCERIIQRRWKATDECGNTAECDQVITIVDTEGPDLTCPGDVSVECDESTDPSNTGMGSAVDNCNDVSVSYTDEIVDEDCGYTILRSWTAVDACGNESCGSGGGNFEDKLLTSETDFSGDETHIDFDENGPAGGVQEIVGNEYAGLGLLISSPTNDAISIEDVSIISAINSAPNALANFGLQGNPTVIKMTFDSKINRIGFFLASNNADDLDVVLTCMLSGNPVAGELFSTDLNSQFFGFESANGFDEVTFEAVGPSFNTFAIDDLRFEGGGCCVQTIRVLDTTDPVWTACPDDATVECTESADPQNINGWASATDNCTDDVTITYADVTTEGDCGNEYTIERTWTAVDDCGNDITKVQTIEVLDVTPPVITCPSDATVECTDEPHPDFTGEATATDDCGDVTVSYSDVTALGNCPAEYSITRTWTAVDACGNEASCPQTINVLDTQKPDLTCAADITIECDESADPANTGTSVATDECSDVTVTYQDATISDDLCERVVQRRWKATDACDNTSECDQFITIRDTEGPSLTCPGDVSVECDESTDPSNTGMGSAVDNCNDVSVSYSDEIIDEDCGYTIKRSWTAVDACGNESCGNAGGSFVNGILTSAGDFSGGETVIDFEGFVHDEQILEQYAAQGIHFNANSQIVPRIFNNDGAPQGIAYLNNFDGNSGHPVEVTFDSKQNRFGFMTRSNIDDDVELQIICMSNNVVVGVEIFTTDLDWSFAGIESAAGFDKIIYSGVGVANGTAHIDALRFEGGECCVQTIRVLDTTDPDWTYCPADLTVECTDSVDPQNTGGIASATDNCSDDVTVTYTDMTTEGDCDNEYVIERTFTAVDNCGNNTSKVQTIEVLDITPPVITCPADATVECSDDPTPDLTGEATATDDCGDVTITYADVTAAGNCPAEYTITRTWTAVDACGNEASCPQTINVLDIQKPDLTCAADITIECDESTEPANTGTSVATDECSDVTVTYQDANLVNALCEQVIVRRWKVTDECGNTSECDQTITVRDTQGPEVTAPEDMTVECDASTDPADTGEATATDNCNGETVDYSDEIVPGECEGEYTILRTWTAVDACENSCEDHPYVGNADFESGALAPEWDGIGNTSANTGDGDILPDEGTYQAKISSSNDVGQAALETFLELPVGTLDALGPGDVTSGSAIKQTITAVAGQTLTFRWNFATDELDQLPIFNDFGFVTIVDNNVIILATRLDPGFLPTTNYDGQTGYMDFSYTFTSSGTCVLGFGVTDVADNIVESTLFVDAISQGCPVQTIYVVDTTPPDWTYCPDDTTVECTDSVDPQNTNGYATATDACSDVTVSYTDVTTEGDCDNEFTIERIWTATDDCGNNTSKVQTIEVLDITPPVISCPEDATVECTDVPHPDLTGEASATDDCGDVTISYADVTAAGDCPAEYTITRTWTAVDACGNESSCPQLIEVLDIQDPVLTCAADITIECDESAGPDNTGYSTATDECSDVTVTYQDATISDDLCERVIQRRWKATDACDNTSECDQFITIRDTEGPDLTCPGDVSVECDESTDPSNTGMGTAVDNCNDVSVSYTDEIIDEDCGYTILRSWTAVDACENESCGSGGGNFVDKLLTSEAEFSGDEEYVNFDNVSGDPSTLVAGNEYAAQGLTISSPDNGTIWFRESGNSLSSNAVNSNPNALTTWTDAAPTTPSTEQVKLTFASKINRIGFYLATNLDDDVEVAFTCMSGGNVIATEVFLTEVSTQFFGIENAGGFDEVVFEAIGAQNARFALDDLRFEGGACCVQTIRVLDTTDPDWTYCPADLTVECTDSVDPQSTGGIASATDNCTDDVTVTYTDMTTEGDCDNEYVIERTFTAVDDCGNNTSKVQTIEVLDITPPVITCPADATIECTVDPTPYITGMATATDDCGDVTISYADITAAGECPAEYTITRTWTAVDACGNESSCPQIIQVLDIVAPDLTCAADVTIECDESTEPDNTGWTTATDECSDVTITYQEAITTNETCLQVILRRWKVTDECGNTSECDQTITVKDTQGPEVTAPEDMTVECDASTDPADTGEATATDNCTDVSVTYNDVILDGDCEGEYTILRTWNAVDECDNSCSNIANGGFESGALAPEWDGIGNTSANTADGDILPVEGSYQARISSSNDVGQGALETFLELPGGTLDALGPGDVTSGSAIKQTITAVAGQTLTFNWNFATDELDQLPIYDDFGFVTIVDDNVVILATRLDPGFLPTTNYDGQTGYMSYTHTFTSSGTCVLGFGVTDVADNVVESTLFVDAVTGCPVQRINVVDTTPPIWTNCPDDTTLECTESTDTQNTGGWASATDACSDVTVSYADVTAEGDCDNEYTIERTWTAVDDCGNNTSKVQTIEVLDITPPVIYCPDDATIECTVVPHPENTGEASATDDCGDVTVTYADVTAAGDCPAEYTITRTWTAVDACGNESSCPQTIEVLDIQDPDLECAADITIECDESTEPDHTGWSVATDECSDVTVEYMDATFEGECPETLVIQRRWTATDACGNTDECDQIIRLYDLEGPTITCPDDITANADKFFCDKEQVEIGFPTWTDNCDEDVTVSYTRSDGEDIGAAYPVGTTEIEWVALGLCSGESDTCVQTITIVDSQPPTVICKKISVALNDDEGLVYVPAQFMYEGVFDNCTDQEYLEETITVSQTIFDCSDYPQVLVEVCATDEAGNVGCCFATVKIQDNFAPNAVCNDLTVEILNGEVEISALEIGLGSTDNSDDCDLFMEVNPSVFTVDDEGVNDVTLTVTDIAGNVSTCNAQVTVVIPGGGNESQISAKVWIEGAMNQSGTAMIPTINDLLPLAQPFNTAPFNYEGTEVAPEIPVDAIDWVLIELRDEADPTMVIRTRAGLLMSDGYIKDLDGVTPITFDNLGDGMYYLTVRHRNHVSVISDAAIEILSGIGVHDFTTGGAMGAEPMKLMTNGSYALWCGDLNADGVIDAGDRSIAWNMRNQTGYLQADATMDGVVDASERSITWNNRNKASGLPQ